MMASCTRPDSFGKLLPLSASSLGCRLRLFCLPSAGAGAVMFRGWLGATDQSLEVHPLELPGRGARRADPVAADLQQCAGQLAREMLPLLRQPFTIYGHSYGGMLGFELAAQLTRVGFEPAHLFVSACRPPHLAPKSNLHELDDQQLVGALRDFAGIPDAVLREPDLMAHFLPVIRADLCRVERYRCNSPDFVLPCPVTIMAGAMDPYAPPDGMEGWHKFTNGRFRTEQFPGGHFFVKSQEQGVIGLIRSVLQESNGL